MPVPRSTPPASTRGLLDALTIGVLAAVAGLVAFAFAWPWFERPPPGGPVLARYAPVRDGAARTFAYRDPSGAPAFWETRNTVVEPAARTFLWDSATRPAVRDVFGRFYELPPEGRTPARLGPRFADVQVVQERLLQVGRDGDVNARTTVYVQEPRGLFILGQYDEGDARTLTFEPPVLVVPADARPGLTWQSRAARSDGAEVALDGRVLDADVAAGENPRCLTIEVRASSEREGRTTQQTLTQNRYCADVGLVEQDRFDAQGALTRHGEMIAADGAPARGDLLPSAPQPPGETATDLPVVPDDPSSWALTQIGRSRPRGDRTIGRSTIPPTWIAGDPPLLLTAAYQGDLVAFLVGDATGNVTWTYHHGATTYGPPAVDQAGGRIYFGATDKRLHALDTRGLFLWSFLAGDNIAGRPLVVDDLVVFGREDYRVYALDGATGALRWTAMLGGSTVSSPAVAYPGLTAGGQESAEPPLVIIGCDDGDAYALDLRTGDERWRYTTDGPIVAPIVVDEGVAYVASRDGTLAALDVSTGRAIWTSDVGATLNTAPALGTGRVAVVASDGSATVVDQADGARLRTHKDRTYSGPPLYLGSTLMLAAEDGSVSAADADGTIRARWEAADTEAGGTPRPFRYGLTAAGGAVWAVDDGSSAWRLGAPQAGPGRLRVAWDDFSIVEGRVSTNLVSSAPVDYRGQILIMNTNNQLVLFDPTTGESSTIGGFSSLTSQDAHIEPVVSGDLALIVVGDTLYAIDVPQRLVPWQFSGQGGSLRPPVISGDTVFWITARPTGTSREIVGVLHALDLETGMPRWEAPLGEVFLPGGVAVQADTVFTSSPAAAFDVRTGASRWTADLEGRGYGGPALDQPGGQLLVATSSSRDRNGLVALDSATGRTLWRAELGDAGLHPYDRPWVAEDTIVVPSVDDWIVALDAATGAERWRRALAPPDQRSETRWDHGRARENLVRPRLRRRGRAECYERRRGRALERLRANRRAWAQPGPDLCAQHAPIDPRRPPGGPNRSASAGVLDPGSPVIRNLPGIPIRRAGTVLATGVGLVVAGAGRELVWRDLRGGMIRLNGLPRPVQAAALAGFTLLFALLGALVFNELWRTQSPLISLPLRSGVTTRGDQVPLRLLPVMLFVLATTWSFALTGALHAHPALRIGVLVAYLVPTARWLAGTMTAGSYPALVLLSWAAYLAVPGVFALRWRAPARPALELAAMLLLVGAALAPPQLHAIVHWRLSGDLWPLSIIGFEVIWLGALVSPLLLSFGLDIADSARRFSGWLVETATVYLPSRAVLVACALGLGWRLVEALFDTVSQVRALSASDLGLVTGAAREYGGGLGVMGGVWGIWWMTTRSRWAAPGSSVGVEQLVATVVRHGLSLIVLYEAANLVISLIAGLVVAVVEFDRANLLVGDYVVPAPVRSIIGQASSATIAVQDWAAPIERPWKILAEVAAVAASFWLARRTRHALALYLGIFGTRELWLRLVQADRPAAPRESDPVDLAWTILLVLAALFWWRRDRLTQERATRLLFLTVLITLARQASLVQEPLGPLFAGAGLIAFGLIWNVLTKGAWTNGDSPGLPRTSRVFLYLGATLAAVSLVTWVVVGHQLSAIAFLTDSGTLRGFERFGKPLIYGIIALTLAAPDTAADDARPASTDESNGHEPSDRFPSDPDGPSRLSRPVGEEDLHPDPLPGR